MKKYIYITLIGLFLGACKVPKIIKNQTLQESPKNFSEINAPQDSTHLGSIPWKSFFQDTTLIRLIDISLKNNYDIQIALQNIQMAQAQTRFHKGNILPNVSIGASASVRKFGAYTMDGAGNATTDITPGKIVPTNLPDYFVGFQASWEADIWRKLRNRKQAAVFRYFASQEGKNVLLTNLVAQIAIHYYQLLKLENELTILQETIQIQENALEIVRFQKEVGTANELAVKQFEVQTLLVKNMENEAKQNIFQTQNQINLLLARYPQPIFVQKENLIRAIPHEMKVGIPSHTLKNRPDIRQAEYEYLASIADLKSARADFLPSFVITGSLGFQAFNPKYLFYNPESIAYSLLGGIFAPLINRNGIKAQFNMAEAYQKQAFFNYQKTMMEAYTEVSNQLQLMQYLQQSYELKNKEVETNLQAVEAALELFKTGRATYLEVLLTQQNFLRAKLELVDIKNKQWETHIYLYKTLGGGWN